MQTIDKPVDQLSFTLRPLTPTDIPAAVALHQEVEKLEPSGDYASVTEYEERLNGPSAASIVVTLAFAPNPDGSEGKLVGELVVDKDERKEWAWVKMLIHPDYRLRGLGRTFYDRAVEDVRQRGGNALHFGPDEKHTLMIDFLKRRGYEAERHFWQMRIPIDAIVVHDAKLPQGFSVRTFVRGQDEQAFMDVRNGSFAEHYGSIARTLDEMIAITKLPHFDPAGLFLAFADNGDVAGLCLTIIDPDKNAARGEEVGWVNTIGVVPAYQRHGLGRALLLIGVNHLRRTMPIVGLWVEGKNAKALPLYEGVGFVRYKSTVNMIKTLEG